MGLFSRKTGEKGRAAGNSSDELEHHMNDELGELNLPSGKDLDESFLSNVGAEAPSSDAPALRRTPSPAKPSFGIDKAAELMAKLPSGDTELIVKVVRETLAAMNVEVTDIISDADSKEQRLNQQHAQLKEEIQGFEAQINERNQQIDQLLSELRTTTDVKQQLQMSVKESVTASTPAAPAAANKTRRRSATPSAVKEPRPAAKPAAEVPATPKDNADHLH